MSHGIFDSVGMEFYRCPSSIERNTDTAQGFRFEVLSQAHRRKSVRVLSLSLSMSLSLRVRSLKHQSSHPSRRFECDWLAVINDRVLKEDRDNNYNNYNNKNKINNVTSYNYNHVPPRTM